MNSDIVNYTGRKILIGILPLVDWTVLNRRTCAVPNPWYVAPPPPARDCLSCEDLTSVPEVGRKASTGKLYEEFIDTKVPVVVRNAYVETQSDSRLPEIVQAFRQDLSAQVCVFRSNTPWTFDRFLEAAPRKEAFYAQWENCNDRSKKLVRRFFHRPSIVPAAVELTGFSWVAMSRRFSTAKPKLVDFAGGSVAVWIQIEGRFRLMLERRNCHCRLQVDLVRGDVLLVRIDGWELSYVPVEETGDSLAIIPTGYLQ